MRYNSSVVSLWNESMTRIVIEKESEKNASIEERN
jgi:hypothetical protein